MKFDFKRSDADSFLFIQRKHSETYEVVLCVDDGIVASTNNDQLGCLIESEGRIQNNF